MPPVWFLHERHLPRVENSAPRKSKETLSSLGHHPVTHAFKTATRSMVSPEGSCTQATGLIQRHTAEQSLSSLLPPGPVE